MELSYANADTRSHISRFIDGINTETLFQFSRPISPHLAARAEGLVSILELF
jgi:hypothetical protein